MSTDKKIVLVVDDEPDTRTFLSTLLEDNGFEVFTACDGAEASEAMRKYKPDLVSLDVTMPEKSGVKFYRELRESEEWKGVPIIMVTGVAQDFERFISTRRNVPPPDGFVPKPIDQERFVSLAKELT